MKELKFEEEIKKEDWEPLFGKFFLHIQFDGMTNNDDTLYKDTKIVDIEGLDRFENIFVLDSIDDDPTNFINAATAYGLVAGGGFNALGLSKGQKAKDMLGRFFGKVQKHTGFSFADYKEVNIFLRGMFPLVGFKSTSVEYERAERIAGKSHYPLMKMIKLAIEGITSLSTKPIQIITGFGLFTVFLGIIGIIWAIIMAIIGNTVAGWASLLCIVLFMGGVQLLSLGIIGEYVGKIYLETKQRPRYIVSERTWDEKE